MKRNKVDQIFANLPKYGCKQEGLFCLSISYGQVYKMTHPNRQPQTSELPTSLHIFNILTYLKL